jgi:phosphate transport system permease protein
MSPTSVVASPPTTTGRPQARDAAALAFRRRVRTSDRAARWLISVSGVAIIAAVLGIGLFLVLEILPLFQGAKVQQELIQQVLTESDPARLVIVDEHQEKASVLGAEPIVRVLALEGSNTPELIPLPELAGERISAVSRVLQKSQLALGTDRGKVWIGTIQLQTEFVGEERAVRALVESDAIVEAVPGHRITGLAYREVGDRSVLASIVNGTHLIVTRVTTQRPLIGPVRRTQESVPVPLDDLGELITVLLNDAATQLFVGTSQGLVTRWHLPAEGSPQLLETVRVVPHGAVTAMAYVLGDRSVVVGGSDGSVATWSLVRLEDSADGWRLTRIHPFASHPTAVVQVVASPRDKGFITASADGTARLHYMTSERTLAELSLGSSPVAADIAPKVNGAVFLDAQGTLRHWRIHNPHPEISWRALFGKLWYEGYTQPEYVWQSTGGTDDFESKFSLVPLVFGTLKGTFYALLFAVPLAIFGALYCSQFLEKRLRNPIKSTIELMAALPSVVLGFIAGVLLAPLVQGRLMSVLVTPILVPLVAVGLVLVCRSLPVPPLVTATRRHEFWVLTLGAGLGIAVAMAAGPWIEQMFFQGNFQAWLFDIAGIRYDQRNSLVVGWVMGFAVIPIIFTICEDAFSSVPTHLVGASLACGASAWQTAWRVVLPAAGSGVFSAVMVGFGRAVGETMIVLMATGNTPIMDWSIFNGFRALSANIAVEIPEAPYGETLYRVLFVAALVLFAMTFVVNTAAEVIRLRLRRQLQGI